MPALERVTADRFDERILGAATPVLVEFCTPESPTCLAIEPTLERLAGDLEGRLRIVKVDVEAEPELAEAFAIRSVPTLGLFRDGHLKGLQVGAPSTADLEAILRRVA